ncbi:MAG: 2-dehydro-3-deoxygalactonokinase [Proteobacteria bacterium]|nr:2-dehydro-3-deoxygalactonokinase [Pseudomonadota bacterium]
MTVLIGVDWGSTSLRAFAIAADGTAREIRRAEDGVFAGTGDYAGRLRAVLGDWLARWPDAPILLCGMIGSDRGWLHAPYVAAPAGADDIAAALLQVPFERPAFIVPGISFAEGDMREVMRGEETLLLALASNNPDAVVCLPGTHSKWARLQSGRISGFRTHMTGEIRATLLSQGALATGVAQEPSVDAFRAGLAASSQGVTRGLFQARARRLLGTLDARHTAAFVSGVLIGDEVSSAKLAGDLRAPIILAARGAVAVDYVEALAGTGISVIDPEPLAAQGLLLLARGAKLIAA